MTSGMTLREVTVAYGRTVSDGNSGSERLSAELTATLDPALDPMNPDHREQQRVAVEALAYDLRHLVVEWLKRSGSDGVQRALETPAEQEARWRREQEARRREYPPLEEDAP